MSRMILAEKPSLARAIVAAIDSNAKKEMGFFRCDGGKTVVTWLLGHVLEQFQPDDYSEAWQKWDISILPMIPKEWKLKETHSAKATILTVKKLLKEATEVVNAADPDREGQLLVDEFLDFFGWKGNTLRLLLKDLTPEAIRKALLSMKNNKEQEGLKNAALGRQRADWLVGMNASRYFTKVAQSVGHDGVISIGRVQTPTLGLVVRRDLTIESFKARSYYTVFAKVALNEYSSGSERTVRGMWQPNPEKIPLDEDGRLLDRAVADSLLEKIKGKNATITKYEKEDKKDIAPLPYRLSVLQVDANRKYGLTLQQTLEVVQSLYEKQVVSYPRSDCEYLPESHHENAGTIISMIEKRFPSYAAIITGQVDKTRKGRAFNDKKVAEHYAITPTGKTGELNEKELKIFELICARYLLQFMPDHEYRAITAEFVVESETFRAVGRELVNIGWRGLTMKRTDKKVEVEQDLEDDVEDDSTFIPPMNVGERGNVMSGFVQDNQTSPPKPFTDGSLVKAMSNIHVHVSDPEIKKQLKEVDGIGTSATQSQIVERLVSKGFIVRKKKEIRSTETGRVLISALEGGVGSIFAFPDMTAIWEIEIGKVERGEISLDDFINGVAKKVTEIVKSPVNSLPFQSLGKEQVHCLTDGCNGALKKLKSKEGRFFWLCQKPECKKTFSDKNGVPQPRQETLKESPCPSCGETAAQKKGEYGLYWRCKSCDQFFTDVDGVPSIKKKSNRRD